MVNVVAAVAYRFCLALLAAFTQPLGLPFSPTLYRAWEKNGCVFIKRGSETELAGKWQNAVRDNELSLEMLRLPYETRWRPWTWKTPVMEEMDE